MRTQNTAFSSLGRSVAAFMPAEPPPAPGQSLLEPSNVYGIARLASANPPVYTEGGYRTGIVTRAPRMVGDRELYSRGAQRNSMMEMAATGQVERSRYQPVTAWTWTGSFNDFLYRAGGYPQNLGLSFKAPSVPDGIATSAAWGQMRPAPQYRRTIFTNRRYTSGVQPLAAKSQPA